MTEPIQPNQDGKQAMFELPSKLRIPGSRYEEISNRIRILRSHVKSAGVTVPERYESDEFYWQTALDRYHFMSDKLAPYLLNRQERKKVALEIAVEDANEIAKTREEAVKDGLTGAWSRKALDNYLNLIIKKGQRRGRHNGILFIDLDHFKMINDEFGHAKGDEALIKTVDVLQSMTRPTDMVARYGGEELVVVLSDIPYEHVATARAEIIRHEIEKRVKVQNKKGEKSITASIGVTIIKPEDTEINSVYARADGNVYRAKDLGRNCVVDEAGKIETVRMDDQGRITSAIYQNKNT